MKGLVYFRFILVWFIFYGFSLFRGIGRKGGEVLCFLEKVGSGISM